MNVILYLFSECESSLKLRGPTQLLLLEDKRSQGYPCVFFSWYEPIVSVLKGNITATAQ